MGKLQGARQRHSLNSKASINYSVFQRKEFCMYVVSIVACQDYQDRCRQHADLTKRRNWIFTHVGLSAHVEGVWLKFRLALCAHYLSLTPLSEILHLPLLNLNQESREGCNLLLLGFMAIDIIITATMWLLSSQPHAPSYYAESTSWNGSSYEPNELPLDPPLPLIYDDDFKCPHACWITSFVAHGFCIMR